MEEMILASNSPRRKALFSLFGLPFVVKPADVDESQRSAEAPVAYVRRLACEKASAAAQQQSGWVIGADTIVVDGDELLGKPTDPADARRMLWQLRGRTHQVYTGIAILNSLTGQSFDAVCCTQVPMREYTEEEIDDYLATGDPMDKAGAYAIQHAGFHPVVGMSGCYASVMGLPLCHRIVGFTRLGLEVSEDVPARCQAHLAYDCPIFGEILAKGGA
jgi:MAF protein